MRSTRDEEKKQMISTIQTDRRLLQDNIAMRVRYGWALIAIIASVIMLIALPDRVDFQFHPGMYFLALIGFIIAVAMVLMALFSSHYGSSYRLFEEGSVMSIDELLGLEKSLHRKTLYKNQLSSLYCGESLFVTFAAVMCLVVASPVNVLKEHDMAIIAVSMACMFYAGVFLKKRMYRMYQIDCTKLPGKDESSMIGFWAHRIKVVFCQDDDVEGLLGDKPRSIRDEWSELTYGTAVIGVACILETVLITASLLVQSDSPFDYPLRVAELLFLSAIAGFVFNQIGLTFTSKIHPSGSIYAIASWNPLYTYALMMQLVGLGLFVLFIAVIGLYGHDDIVAIMAVLAELALFAASCKLFFERRDLVAATKLERNYRGLQELGTKRCTTIRYSYDFSTKMIIVSVTPAQG